MNHIRAVGFDLGETLFTYEDTPLNWSALYPAALAQTAGHCGLIIRQSEISAAATILTRYNTRLNPRTDEFPAQQIFREILAAWPGASQTLLESAIEAFFSFFQQRVVAYPESSSVLRNLRQHGLRTGALTDAPYGMPRRFVQEDLAGTGLEPHLDAWLTSVEVGHRKPHPAGFAALAKALGIEIAELCYVGNEEKDIRGAKSAGAKAILVDRERMAPDWGQNHTVCDLNELLPFFAAG